MAVVLALRKDRRDDLLLRRSRYEHVDEARAGDLNAVHQCGIRQLLDQGLGEPARWHAQRLGHDHRQVAGEVTELRILGLVDLDGFGRQGVHAEVRDQAFDRLPEQGLQLLFHRNGKAGGSRPGKLGAKFTRAP